LPGSGCGFSEATHVHFAGAVFQGGADSAGGLGGDAPQRGFGALRVAADEQVGDYRRLHGVELRDLKVALQLLVEVFKRPGRGDEGDAGRGFIEAIAKLIQRPVGEGVGFLHESYEEPAEELASKGVAVPSPG